MIRKVTALAVLLLILFVMVTPAIAAGGNGGSSGSGSSGSEGGGNGGGNADDSSGNAGNGAGPTSQADPQAQPIQEEQERKQQETVEQPGVQINQQDRDQDQGRTGVYTTVETVSLDIIRQRDRDTFLQQISQMEQNLSRDQDPAPIHFALSTFSLVGNVTGSSGPELSRLGADVNNSLAAAYQAEQKIKTRTSFMRMLIGGDRGAAGMVIQYADQNKERIQQMEQLLMNCSDCDPQVREMLEEQVQVIAREQNRLITLGQQEQGDRGLFGWLFG